MTTMTCAQVMEVAAELALDLLEAAERAAVLAHLEICAPCRHEVSSLTEASAQLLLLAPDREPSPGFAAGVVAEINRLSIPDPSTASPAATATAPRRWSRRAFALAAATITILALAATLLIRLGPGGETEALSADMRTGSGATVGRVSVEDVEADETSTVTVKVPGWDQLVTGYSEPVNATYWLAVEHDDGSRELHPLPPDEDHTWVIPVEHDPSTIATVSVLDRQGRVWCSARFT
jgi:hypothetical protein